LLLRVEQTAIDVRCTNAASVSLSSTDRSATHWPLPFSEDSATVRRRAAEARLRDYGEEATASGAVAPAANGVVSGAGRIALCSSPGRHSDAARACGRPAAVPATACRQPCHQDVNAPSWLLLLAARSCCRQLAPRWGWWRGGRRSWTPRRRAPWPAPSTGAGR
jgi:hypothetical protein